MWRIFLGLPVGHNLFPPNGFVQKGFVERGAESWAKSSNGQSGPKDSIQHRMCRNLRNEQRFWRTCGQKLIQRQEGVFDLFLLIRWMRRKKKPNPIFFGVFLLPRWRSDEKVGAAAPGTAFEPSAFVGRRRSRTFRTPETSNKPTRHPPREEGQWPEPCQ